MDFGQVPGDEVTEAQTIIQLTNRNQANALACPSD